MAYYFAEGTRFQFATTFAAAKTVTAVSNASPAVATSNAHGFANGDELLFTSGWEDATDSIWRAANVSANTLDLSGLDASNVNFFPAGGGVGSLQKVSSWVEIPQVLNVESNGGGPKFVTVEPLAKRNEIKVPTGFEANEITLTLGHDASLAAYQQMVAVSRTLGKVAFKVIMSGGAVGYGYGYMAASEMPQIQRNQANQVRASITLLGRFISY